MAWCSIDRVGVGAYGLAVLASLAGAGCRTWEDVAVTEMLSVPTAADAPCDALARDLEAPGGSLAIAAIEFSDTNVLALDETLVIRARVPHYSEYTRKLDREEQVDGFDLELQCPYWGDPTPLTVRMCSQDGSAFGIVDAAQLRRLTDHGALGDTCRLWGRLWTGERTRPWMASVIVRPSVRSLVEVQ